MLEIAALMILGLLVWGAILASLAVIRVLFWIVLLPFRLLYSILVFPLRAVSRAVTTPTRA